VIPFEFCRDLSFIKRQSLGYPTAFLRQPMFQKNTDLSQTDRETDTQTDDCGIYRASMASNGIRSTRWRPQLEFFVKKPYVLSGLNYQCYNFASYVTILKFLIIKTRHFATFKLAAALAIGSKVTVTAAV